MREKRVVFKVKGCNGINYLINTNNMLPSENISENKTDYVRNISHFCTICRNCVTSLEKLL